MITFTFGFRLTAKPYLPWKTPFQSWASFLWFHVLMSVSVYKKPKPTSPARIEQKKANQKALDPTKRKTLQPGERGIPKGWRMPDEEENVEPTRLTAGPPLGKPLQPGTTIRLPDDIDEVIDVPQVFEYKFFGSKLLVGNITIASNLNNGLHGLEITPDNKMYIDNIPYTLNPDTLKIVKREIVKARQ